MNTDKFFLIEIVLPQYELPSVFWYSEFFRDCVLGFGLVGFLRGCVCSVLEGLVFACLLGFVCLFLGLFVFTLH